MCIYCITNITNPLQMKFLQQIIQVTENRQFQYLRKYCTENGTAMRHKILGLNTSCCKFLKYKQNKLFPLYRCLKSQLPQDDQAVASFPWNIAAVVGKTYINYYFRELVFPQRDLWIWNSVATTRYKNQYSF